jgi:hypothetical protein
MLITRLQNIGYDFSQLPTELKSSLDLYNEIQKETGGNADQELSSLDIGLFDAILSLDPENEKVLTVKEEYEFEQNYTINDGFNTTGLIPANVNQEKEIQEVKDIAETDFVPVKFMAGGTVGYQHVMKFIPQPQRYALDQMDEKVAKQLLQGLQEDLQKTPQLYGQDGKFKNSVAYLHYFSSASDWYVTELDKETREAFGYTVLQGDYQNAEFGYIPITQIVQVNNIEIDLHWKYKTINEILEKNAPEFVKEPIERYKDPTKENEYFKGLNATYKNPYVLNRAIQEYIEENKSKQTPWTEDERNFIAKFSGYGGLEKFGDFTNEELKGLLYEYYTPDEIVKKMWGLAYKYGYGSSIGTDIVETSAGTGNFFKYAPTDAHKVAYEINPVSVDIIKILYPGVEVHQMPFEKLFIKRNTSIGAKTNDLPKFSLCIGNPPYAKISSFYFKMGEDRYTRAQTYTEYFISRGLDLLVPGGLLIYVVGAEQYNGGKMFLDSGITPAKELIHEKADLVDAYRLPANLFERTGVSTEILVFKKR